MAQEAPGSSTSGGVSYPGSDLLHPTNLLHMSPTFSSTPQQSDPQTLIGCGDKVMHVGQGHLPSCLLDEDNNFTLGSGECGSVGEDFMAAMRKAGNFDMPTFNSSQMANGLLTNGALRGLEDDSEGEDDDDSRVGALEGVPLDQRMTPSLDCPLEPASSLGTGGLDGDGGVFACPQCGDPYQCPRVLACLHVFCEPCLEKILAEGSHRDDTSPSQQPRASSIVCPLCEEITTLTAAHSGSRLVEGLPQDQVLCNLIDTQSIRASKLVCTSCKAGAKAEARCQDCPNYLCPNCVTAHQFMRCFENHHVVSFAEIVSGGGEAVHRPGLCTTHPSENIVYYCTTCQVPVCGECVRIDHAVPSHYVQLIEDVIMKEKERLNGLVKRAALLGPACEEASMNTASHLSELQEQTDATNTQVDKVYQEIDKVVARHKAAAKKQLAGLHENMELRIMDTTRDMDKHTDQLHVADVFTTRVLAHGNPLEILTVCKMATRQLVTLIETASRAQQLAASSGNSGGAGIHIHFVGSSEEFETAVGEKFGHFQFKEDSSSAAVNTSRRAPPIHQELMAVASNNPPLNAYTEAASRQQQPAIGRPALDPQRTAGRTMDSQRTAGRTAHQELVSEGSSLGLGPGAMPFSGHQAIVGGGGRSGVVDDSSRSDLPRGSSEGSIYRNLYHQHQQQTPLQPAGNEMGARLNFHHMEGDNDSHLLPPSSTYQQHPQQQAPASPYGGGGQGSSGSGSSPVVLSDSGITIDNGGGGGGTTMLNSPHHHTKMLQQQQQRTVPALGDQLRGMTMHSPTIDGAMCSGSGRVGPPSNLPPPVGYRGGSATQHAHQTGGGHNAMGLSRSISTPIGVEMGMGYSDCWGANDPSVGIHSRSTTPGMEAMLSGPQGGAGLMGRSMGSSNSPPNSMGSGEAQQQQYSGGNSVGMGGHHPPFPNRTATKTSPMQIRCKFGQLGQGRNQFNSPHGFCLGVDEDVVVADTNNHRIQIFNKEGELKFHFGSAGREEGQLWYPRKVAVFLNTGRFVVCDRGSERSRMQIFSKTGNFIKKVAIRYIDIVAGLAITQKGTGHIVAVDSVTPTVFVIGESGELIKWFDCSDYMREPSDIAIWGSEYYVCDFKGHNVTVFGESGAFLRRIGSERLTNFPNGIDISEEGDVLVGDSHGNRFHVAVFRGDGSLIGEFECPYVKVSRCCGLKITNEGYVVTLAKNNHHVLVLNTLYIN